MIYSWKKIVSFSLPLLTLCVLIEIFAGQILQNDLDTLVLFPIFLITIPVINSVGGNIGSVLGARLASGLHVGYISISIDDKEMHENLLVSVLIGLVTFVFLGLIIYFIYSSLLTYLDIDISLFDYLVVILCTGFLLVLVVSLVSVVTAFWSFKKGLDPDDMVAPMVTTFADVFGIVFLFVMIRFIGLT